MARKSSTGGSSYVVSAKTAVEPHLLVAEVAAPAQRAEIGETHIHGPLEFEYVTLREKHRGDVGLHQFDGPLSW